MPLLKLEASVPIDKVKQERLIPALSRILSDVTGKPEAYSMVTLTETAGGMGGAIKPIAFADVRGIGGFTPKVNAEISKRIAELLKKELNINSENVYLTFTEVAATNWGWKGGTFG